MILDLCEMKPAVRGIFFRERPVIGSFDASLNQLLSKQSRAGDSRRYDAHNIVTSL